MFIRHRYQPWKKLTQTCFVLSLLLFIQQTMAVSIGLLTLHDAVMLALRNNPALVSAELDRVNQKFSLAIAYHAFEPTWSLGGTSNYTQTKSSGVLSSAKSLGLTPDVKLKTAAGTSYDLKMLNPVSEYYNPQVTLGITQPLLQGNGPEINLASLYDAFDTERTNRWSLRDNVQDTIVKVIKDYRAIINNEQSLVTQKIQLANSLKNIQDIKVYIKAGSHSQSELISAQSTIPANKLAIVQSENSIFNARQTLLQDLGLDPDVDFTIEKKINVPPVKLPTQEEAIQLALLNNTSYQTALLDRRQLRRALLIAEDGKRWKLDATANVAMGGGSGGGSNASLPSLVNGQNYSREVILNLTIPVDTLPLQQAIIVAKIAIQKNEININNLKRQTVSNVITQLTLLRIQQQQIKLGEQSAKLSQQVLEQAIKKSKYGQASQFEINTDRQDLTTKQLNLISTNIDYLNSLTDFNRLLGKTLPDWHIRIRY